jgi:hypothetical protein
MAAFRLPVNGSAVTLVALIILVILVAISSAARLGAERIETTAPHGRVGARKSTSLRTPGSSNMSASTPESSGPSEPSSAERTSSSSSRRSSHSTKSSRSKRALAVVGAKATRTRGDRGRSACFPASSTVSVEDGRTIRMDELAVGDSVHVGSGRYSHVFMFTHKLANPVHSFFRVTTASGHSIVATSGHYLYVNGQVRAARTALVGDKMRLGTGGETEVVRVERRVVARGLFSPMTVSGEIVVDGLAASTYTTAVEPALSHVLLAPARAIFQWCGLDVTLGSLEGGAPSESLEAFLGRGTETV